MTGCCILLPCAVVEKVGYLDESFFMYYEDVDYSLRLGRNGIKMLYVPTAKLWHKVSRAAGTKSPLSVYYGNRNRFYILKKYHIGASAWFYTAFTRIIRLLTGAILNNNDRYIWRAWRDYKKGIMGKVDI